MKRLFAVEFARLRRQTSALVIGFIILALGGFNVLLAWITKIEINPGEFEFFFTARSILESSFQTGQIQILLIGVVTSLFIATDITQGTIRNKIIAGYSKFEIYVVQMLMSAFITFSALLLFHLLPSAFSWLITFPTSVDDAGTIGNFFIHMSFGYGLMITGALLTTWLALKAKTTAAAIIFTLLIYVLGPTLTTIVKTIIEATVLLDIDQFLDLEAYQVAQRQINGAFEWVYFYQVQRLANISSFFDFISPTRLNFFSEDTQPYIWKTLGTNLGLITILITLGGKNFAKSDLR
ncbi:MAG: hypothetical protein ACO22H_03325 [Bacilli bacterium]